jgi:uncharacterized repeat protein (TIGR03803 family)
MTNPRQIRGLKSILRQHAATAGLAFAVVFALSALQTAQAQTFTVLYSFAGGNDGSNPFAGLVRDAAGNLYGTTYFGGGHTQQCTGGCGTVFKLTKAGHETVLHRFTSGKDGNFPQADLLLDASGNLYGTTTQGGNGGGPWGTVFKLNTADKLTVLHNFTDGSDGADPAGGLSFDANGNLYGTAGEGGAVGQGVVFKLAKTGKETVLHSFQGGTDGAFPVGNVIRDAAGNLYGTTSDGGGGCGSGCGTVFKIDKTGKETILHHFSADGGFSHGLVRDAAGNLYGSAGPASGGDVFKLNKNGKETVLHQFAGYPTDGSEPDSALVRDAKGNLYGTTYTGGPGPCSDGINTIGCGIVFRLTPPAGRGGKWKETILYSFNGGSDGYQPEEVVLDAAGNLYGVASAGGNTSCNGGCGVVFKITP